MRTACPTCTCGFKENNSLFPSITTAKIQQTLRKIRSNKALVEFLKSHGIQARETEGILEFPPGICRGVSNKIRVKVQELSQYGENQLGLYIDYTDFTLGNPWTPKDGELHIDE